jgi:hypothetical protein
MCQTGMTHQIWQNGFVHYADPFNVFRILPKLWVITRYLSVDWLIIMFSVKNVLQLQYNM